MSVKSFISVAALAAVSGLGTSTASAQVTHTVLSTFGGAAGFWPEGVLMADPAGNLYGTTRFGGATNNGTVFKIPGGTTATPGALTTLHSFNGTAGRLPNGGLVADAAGNLYGTTEFGGASSGGTVFKIPGGTTAAPGALTTLHSFVGSLNGSGPTSTPILDAAGNLYGTTQAGGGSGRRGTIFKIANASSATPAALTTLHRFSTSTGGNALAGVTADASGNLYGVTTSGGLVGPGASSGGGSVYKLAGGATDTPGAFSTLHAFSGPDGAGASGDLIVDALGNLYGTTGTGGANGLGTVFKIPGGATATPGALVTLATFNGTNGSNPLNAGLLADAAGNLFGVTNQGGTNNVGTVFMIPGGATATPGALTTLWSFSDFNTGSPLAGLIADGSGNLYGTTQGNIGTVYKISGAGFVVPAPGAVALLGLGGLMAARRRRGVAGR